MVSSFGYQPRLPTIGGCRGFIACNHVQWGSLVLTSYVVGARLGQSKASLEERAGLINALQYSSYIGFCENHYIIIHPVLGETLGYYPTKVLFFHAPFTQAVL